MSVRSSTRRWYPSTTKPGIPPGGKPGAGGRRRRTGGRGSRPPRRCSLHACYRQPRPCELRREIGEELLVSRAGGWVWAAAGRVAAALYAT
eukprot:scaffold2931_cov154-Isochrysis_galbana.AAC.2